MTPRRHLDDDVRDVLLALRAAGCPDPVEELRWHPTRRWRFDGAYPAFKLAYEIEGGTWIAGRHSRGKGFENDCAKYSEAALAGWRVLRFTEGMVRDGRMFEMLHRALPAPTRAPETAH